MTAGFGASAGTSRTGAAGVEAEVSTTAALGSEASFRRGFKRILAGSAVGGIVAARAGTSTDAGADDAGDEAAAFGSSAAVSLARSRGFRRSAGADVCSSLMSA